MVIFACCVLTVTALPPCPTLQSNQEVYIDVETFETRDTDPDKKQGHGASPYGLSGDDTSA